MEPNDAARQAAEQAQYLAGLKDTARNAKAFHEMLTGEGMTGVQAAIITGHWLGASVGAQTSSAVLRDFFESMREDEGE